MPVRAAAMAAGLLALAACQQPTEELEHAAGFPAQLPDRPNGANTILTEQVTVAEGLEAIVQDAVFPPNADLPAHYHPGEELLYMIEGTVTLMQEGSNPIDLKAGDAHMIAAGTNHRAKAGANGARTAIFRVHPAGEPMRVLLPVEQDSGMSPTTR